MNENIPAANNSTPVTPSRMRKILPISIGIALLLIVATASFFAVRYFSKKSIVAVEPVKVEPALLPVLIVKDSIKTPADALEAEKKSFSQDTIISESKFMVNGKKINPKSCSEYRVLKTKGAVIVIDDESDFSVGPVIISECDTLTMLSKLQPSKSGFVRNLPLNEKLVEYLPAEFVLYGMPTDDFDEDIAKGITKGLSYKALQDSLGFQIGEFDIENTVPYRLIWNNDMLIEVQGFGDYDGDGVDDMVIQLVQDNGMYGQFNTIVLSRTSDTAILRIISNKPTSS